MIEVGQEYTHCRKSGRYTVTSLPLSSGALRIMGLEFVNYQCLLTTRKFVRLKSEFKDVMILLPKQKTNQE